MVYNGDFSDSVLHRTFRQHLEDRSYNINEGVRMELVMCSPHEYYGDKFSAFIENERVARQHKWIYEIIRGSMSNKNEQVFLNSPAWSLCLDKHHGTDHRYLIVFKDRSLLTVRDLRQKHIPLLEDIYQTVRDWVTSRHNEQYFLYFHYMPSVFQLHIHVNSNRSHINWDRAHLVSRVISNLKIDSDYYKNAIFLTKFCKTMRRADAHTKLPLKVK